MNWCQNWCQKIWICEWKQCSLRKGLSDEKKEQLEKQINRLKKIREDLGMNRTEFSQYFISDG